MPKLIIYSVLALLGLGAEAAYASRTLKVVESNEEIERDLIRAFQEAPLHKEIRTTVFWIGERAKPNSGWSSNYDSAWDRRWKERFGGLDSPIYRKGFFPAKFVPKENPFYVALPFNDISNPEFAENSKILQYFKKKIVSRQQSSVCKNRWIEINCNGRLCYGQWQDVGPVYTNDFPYVFQGENPRAHERDMAGLDVSPAIRDYLGFRGMSWTSWRFIDEEEVPDGPWKEIVTRS